MWQATLAPMRFAREDPSRRLIRSGGGGIVAQPGTSSAGALSRRSSERLSLAFSLCLRLVRPRKRSPTRRDTRRGYPYRAKDIATRELKKAFHLRGITGLRHIFTCSKQHPPPPPPPPPKRIISVKLPLPVDRLKSLILTVEWLEVVVVLTTLLLPRPDQLALLLPRPDKLLQAIEA